MDFKKLKELYEEYKKIGQPKGYADGGDVKSTPSPDEQGFFDSVRKAFSAPTPAPTPDDTLEQKYKKIRDQNNSNATGKTSVLDQKIYNKGGKVKGYADGTDEGEPVQADEQPDTYDPNVPDEPGLSPEEYEKHIQDLKDKGIKVEDIQGDQVSVNGELPVKLQDVEDKEDIDKKAIEAPYDTEEEGAELAADDAEEKNKKDAKDSDEDTSEEDDAESDKDESRDPASDELNDQQKQDIAQSGFSGKAEGIAPPKKNGLDEAIRQRNLTQNLQDIGKYATILGSGIARTDPKPYLNLIQDRSQQPIEDYKMQVADQQNDPNSAMSKVVKDYYKGKGINVPENASAADITKVAPYYMKDAALQTAIQKVLTQQQGALTRNTASNKTKTDIADKNRGIKEQQLKIEQQKADAATKNAEGNKELKAQAAQDRTLSQTKQMLESARGNPAAAQAEKDMYSVDKANSLFKLYPDLDNIPDAQVNLITSEIAKVAQGGVPTGHEIDALKPNTPESKLQKLFGQLQNEPKPANLGAYLKELKKYTAALHNDAKKVIQDKYGRVIESSKKQLGDDNYKALQDQYMNRFNPPEQKEHPQDRNAIEWAKANGKDPRAAAILKANGIN